MFKFLTGLFAHTADLPTFGDDDFEENEEETKTGCCGGGQCRGGKE